MGMSGFAAGDVPQATSTWASEVTPTRPGRRKLSTVDSASCIRAACQPAVHPSADRLPEGQILHAAGPSSGGSTIIAVHESQESWDVPGRHHSAPDAARYRRRLPDTIRGDGHRPVQGDAVAPLDGKRRAYRIRAGSRWTARRGATSIEATSCARLRGHFLNQKVIPSMLLDGARAAD